MSQADDREVPSDLAACVDDGDNNSSLNSSQRSLCTDNVAVTSGIVVEHSTDVQFGTRLLYNAPVTINQYVTSSTRSQRGVITTSGVVEHCDRLCRWPAYSWIIALTVTICVVTLCLLMLNSWTTTSTYVWTQPTDVDIGAQIISKSDWGGHATLLDRPHWILQHPTPYIIITHTGGNPCYNTNTCANECRNIQTENVGGRYEMADISLNFLVGGGGHVYEGRGWDLTNPFRGFAFLRRHNIAVAFMGNFVFDKPTPAQISATLALIDLGVQLGKVDPAYRLLAHNETTPTASPGTNVYAVIKGWSHFWIPV